MAKSLGLRAEPHAVHWAVVEGSKAIPLLLGDDTLRAPKTFTEAAALAWFRSRVVDIIRQHAVAHVGVRYAETHTGPSRKLPDRQRARIEGVIMEAAKSAGIEPLTGALNTMTAAVNAESAADYLDAEAFRGVRWDRRPRPRREAILVAIAALGDA